MTKSVYLANHYGFSTQLRSGALQDICEILKDLGLDVHEPFGMAYQFERARSGWAYRIGQEDMKGVYDTDGFFGVVNGVPPDEGVMVELGMAIAWKKPTFLFRDDFRNCTDSEEYPLNLMLYTGLPEKTWEKYWYTSLDELRDPDKALALWIEDKPLP